MRSIVLSLQLLKSTVTALHCLLANEFETYLESFGVNSYQFGAPIVFPEADRVRIFDSEEAIDEYIVNVDYGREGTDRPLIHFGVCDFVFTLFSNCGDSQQAWGDPSFCLEQLVVS